MKTAQAIIFLTKAIIETFLWLKGVISNELYHSRLQSLRDAIDKAKSPDLNTGLDGASDVENRINRHTH